jgi:hypothetical protein
VRSAKSDSSAGPRRYATSGFSPAVVIARGHRSARRKIARDAAAVIAAQ